jgi:hypothetical protein
MTPPPTSDGTRVLESRYVRQDDSQSPFWYEGEESQINATRDAGQKPTTIKKPKIE